MNQEQEPKPEKAQSGLDRWKRYAAAAEGFREYWYPVMAARKLGRKIQTVKIAGRDIMLLRDAGKAYALEDRCPHREIPLSLGTREFPGHITCIYHGWVFDVRDGMLKAALPDGPDSPIVGKVCVHSFPVEERCGLIWLWAGDGEPVPVEDDIPDEMLKPDARVYPFLRLAEGNWRYACENGFDEAHGKMLHRSSYWVFFKRMAGWNETEIVRSEDGKWISRYQHSVHEDDEYPGLGRWPRFNFWQRRTKQVAQGSNDHAVGIRLPGILRVRQPGRANWTHYEWYIPIDRTHYRYLVFAVSWVSGFRRFTWWLRYWLYILWIHHYNFNNQDLRIVKLQGESHPERLFRPDISITAWRRMVEDEARHPPPAAGDHDSTRQAAE